MPLQRKSVAQKPNHIMGDVASLPALHRQGVRPPQWGSEQRSALANSTVSAASDRDMGGRASPIYHQTPRLGDLDASKKRKRAARAANDVVKEQLSAQHDKLLAEKPERDAANPPPQRRVGVGQVPEVEPFVSENSGILDTSNTSAASLTGMGSLPTLYGRPIAAVQVAHGQMDSVAGLDPVESLNNSQLRSPRGEAFIDRFHRRVDADNALQRMHRDGELTPRGAFPTESEQPSGGIENRRSIVPKLPLLDLATGGNATSIPHPPAQQHQQLSRRSSLGGGSQRRRSVNSTAVLSGAGLGTIHGDLNTSRKALDVFADRRPGAGGAHTARGVNNRQTVELPSLPLSARRPTQGPPSAAAPLQTAPQEALKMPALPVRHASPPSSQADTGSTSISPRAAAAAALPFPPPPPQDRRVSIGQSSLPDMSHSYLPPLMPGQSALKSPTASSDAHSMASPKHSPKGATRFPSIAGAAPPGSRGSQVQPPQQQRYLRAFHREQVKAPSSVVVDPDVGEGSVGGASESVLVPFRNPVAPQVARQSIAAAGSRRSSLVRVL